MRLPLDEPSLWTSETGLATSRKWHGKKATNLCRCLYMGCFEGLVSLDWGQVGARSAAVLCVWLTDVGKQPSCPGRGIKLHAWFAVNLVNTSTSGKSIWAGLTFIGWQGIAMRVVAVGWWQPSMWKGAHRVSPCIRYDRLSAHRPYSLLFIVLLQSLDGF
jgi:hypothetical protein